MKENGFVKSYNEDELKEKSNRWRSFKVRYEEDEDGKRFAVACIAS